MADTRQIQVFHDPDAGVWWAESEDIPGLISEAATFDALCDRVSAVAPELLAANEGPLGGPVSLEFVVTRQIEMA